MAGSALRWGLLEQAAQIGSLGAPDMTGAVRYRMSMSKPLSLMTRGMLPWGLLPTASGEDGIRAALSVSR